MPQTNPEIKVGSTPFRETGPELSSYVLAVISVPIILHYHLLPTVFAGLTVHILTMKLAGKLPAQWGGLAHKFALAVIVTIVVTGLFGVGLGLWSHLHGSRGMAALLTASAQSLDNLRGSLPKDIAELIPTTMEDLRVQASVMLREHSHKVSAAGMAGLSTIIHVTFGMVIGGLTAIHQIDHHDGRMPLTAALYSRLRSLADAFDKVVFAQVKISAFNTVFTAIYLLVILPLAGVKLPMLTILIPLTFIAGLLPVFGNLISNGAIVLISFGISPAIAVTSLVFLVVIHKLEYFLNARIVGKEVKSSAWELLSAMIFMEAVFGIPGLISAPVVYAWVKEELIIKELI